MSPASACGIQGVGPCISPSTIIDVEVGATVNITVPVGGHVYDVEPTFYIKLLDQNFSNSTSTTIANDIIIDALKASLTVPGVTVIPRFTLIPGFCIDIPFDGEKCTPAVIFPGVSSPSFGFDVGPVFTTTIPVFSQQLPDIYTPDVTAWPLLGFNVVSFSPPFELDKEVRPTARIAALSVVDEGDVVAFDGSASSDPDIGETLTHRWNFDDGTTDSGAVVDHVFDDNKPGSNPPYDVSLTVDDGHVLDDTAFHPITVNNVAPSVSAGSDKTVKEGSVTGLGLDIFGRNLAINGDAESPTLGWSVAAGTLVRAGYAGAGTATSSIATLVNQSTPGYYNSGIGTSLDGSSSSFQPLPGAQVGYYDMSAGQGNSNQVASIQAAGHTAVNITDPTSSQLAGVDVLYAQNPSNGSNGSEYLSRRNDIFNWVAGGGTLIVHDRYVTEGGELVPSCVRFITINIPIFGQITIPVPCNFVRNFDRGADINVQTASTVSNGPGGVVNNATLDGGNSSNHGYVSDTIGTVLLNNGISGQAVTFTYGHGAGNVIYSTIPLDFYLPGNSPLNFRNIYAPNVVHYGAQLAGATGGPGAPGAGLGNPNLATAANLGSWLGRFQPSGGSWSGGLVGIPSTWVVGDETAIVYQIDAPEGGIRDMRAFFDVDNGIFVWVNGAFKFGAVEEGGLVAGFEYRGGDNNGIRLGDIPAGRNYIQVLREDHGGGTGYEVLITGTVLGGPPALDSPGPAARGSFLFADGNSDTVATQVVDVSEGDEIIDRGEAGFRLSADLGGFADERDNAKLEAIFRNGAGAEIGRARIGPVTNVDRGNVTGLQSRTTTQTLTGSSIIPPLTRSIVIQATLDMVDGLVNNAVMDNADLTLIAQTGANFTDPGAGDTHTAFIQWGDGQSEAGVVQQGRGLGSVLADHVYADNCSYTVTVTITDDDGASTPDSFVVTVENVAPTVTPIDRIFINGQARTVQVASFTDPAFDCPNPPCNPATAETFEAFIAWGDTQTTPFFGVSGGVVVATQTYNLGGSFPQTRPITTTVRDDDTGTTTVVGTATIVNRVIPGVNAGGDRTINESNTTGFNGSFQLVPGTPPVFDPNLADPTLRYEYKWDFGDGSGTPPQNLGTFGGQSVPRTISLAAANHQYVENGQYAVTLTVLAFDTTTGRLAAAADDTLLVNVNNVAPVVNALGNQSTSEGGAISLPPASFSDVGSVDTHTARIDWGDGIVDVAQVTGTLGVGGAPSTGTVFGSHTYADDGVANQYTVTVTVTDDEGDSGSRTFVAFVSNVNPTVTAPADFGSNEGSVVGVSASFSDPGFDRGQTPTAEDFTATIDWRDGVVDTVSVSEAPGQPGQATTGSVSGTHVYADNGTYDVIVRVCDDDLGCGQDIVRISVGNVTPTVLGGQILSTNEGAEVSLPPVSFSDRGTLDTHPTATVDWGDGSAATSGVVTEAPFGPPGSIDGADGTVAGSHVYADNGSYTVTVCVTDDDTDTGCGQLTINVSNVAPSINAGSSQTDTGDQANTEGATVSLDPATFNDVGTKDTHTATVDWGDGTATDDSITGGVTVSETPTGPPGNEAGTDGSIAASHVYADDGTFQVTVCVKDDEGAEACGTLSVVVVNVDPSVTPGADRTIDEGNSIALQTLATYSDAGFDQPATPSLEDFEGTIDWGDGTVEAGAITETPGGAGSATTGAVSGSHTYPDNGVFDVTITVTDDDRGVGSASFQVTVNNVAPTITSVLPAQTTFEGIFISLPPLAFEDPGFDNPPGASVEDFTVSIDWGDGTTEPSQDIDQIETPGDVGLLTTGTGQASHAYADNGTYQVTVCVTDDDNGQDCETFEVEVANLPPSVEAGNNQTVDEGERLDLDPVTFEDPGFDCPDCTPAIDKTFTARIDWGDGNFEPTGDIVIEEDAGNENNVTKGRVIASHHYGDDGTYTVRVCVTDEDGAETCDSFQVQVNNVAPTVIPGGNQVTTEGTFIQLDPARYTDPGFDNPAPEDISKATQENFTATIDWGDGNFEPVGDIGLTEGPGSEGVLTTGTVQATHAYGDDGVYTVNICVTDDQGAETCNTLLVTVNNVAPTVIPGANQVTTEGTFIQLDPARYTDPGFDNPAPEDASKATQENFTATIDWGDGNFEPVGDITLTEAPGAEGALTTGTVQATHAYGDDGTYTVTVCVTDDDHDPGAVPPVGGQTCDTLQIEVNNVAPSVEAGPNRIINESDTVFVGPPPASGAKAPATYSDPGFDNLALDVPALATEENFTSTIDWGEGTVDVGVLTEVPGAEGVLTTGTVSGSHVYGDDGVYTVRVCVTDDNHAPNADPPVDGQTCDTFTVEVRNVNPVLDDSVFLDTAITFPSGDDAFLGRKGVEQTHGAKASDVGSDDLRYDWEFVPTPDQFSGTLPSLPITETTTTFNDGSAPGPLPFTDPAREEQAGTHPHGTFPFTSTDTVDVTFTGPGVYRLDLLVTDDNGGTDSSDLTKLVVDDCDCTKSQGFWKHEFKTRKEKDLKKVEKGKLISEETLEAYLDIIRYASSHFGVDTVVPLNSFLDANLILNGNRGNSGSGNGNGNGSVQPLGDTASNNKKKKKKKGDSGSGSGGGSKPKDDASNDSGSNASQEANDNGSNASGDGDDDSGTATNIAKTREKAVRQTLAAWLNFAKGAVELDEDIVIEPGESGSGTGSDAPRPPVTKTFEEIILEVEAILNNPDATKADLEHAKDLAEAINKHDKDNPDCTGSGSGNGSGSGS